MRQFLLRSFFFIFVALLIPAVTFGQNTTIAQLKKASKNRLLKLKQLLDAADSIVIVRHERTHGPPSVDPKTGEDIPLPSLIVNNSLNDAIVRERFLLTKEQIEQLAAILVKPSAFKEEPEVSMCFVPHHAVLMMHSGQLSKLDFCFDCHNFSTSDRIDLDSLDIESDKWDKLREFLKKSGLTFQM